MLCALNTYFLTVHFTIVDIIKIKTAIFYSTYALTLRCIFSEAAQY